ncbi:MAG TPA: FAD-dependent monooxygenase [Oscillatoriaceae cyanobacterium M33_DOE_052]|uniref:FAD-dependent monooxygenase n=1 Tax=Planktothricoides sp. SpSt-374 TaxID=2282167 RepID=A0A7C3ZYX1_9CYAN|nr:FAD-dependent monooxygenase [Oscillatoriaceae cyanobacterium M33_DOE_052]
MTNSDKIEENSAQRELSGLGRSREAIVIGGGPTGLATALMLAKSGGTNITVLEKRPSADFYEPDKSFLYLIDGRGQKFTDLLGITAELSKMGVPNPEVTFTVVQANGSRKTSKMPIIDPTRKTAYWLTRRAFVLLLYQEIERNWQHCIKVLFDTDCVEINQITADDAKSKKLQIVARQLNGSVFTFEPHLLVGADGINSIVRQTLLNWDETVGANRFEMKQFPSPSAGLRYKVLTLPPKLPLDRTGSEYTISKMAYAIRGAFRGRQRSVSLGLLPIQNPDEPRTANIITWPDHDIWGLNDGEQMSDFLAKAFPQLPISEILSPEEVARFAESKGGRFPNPQYCEGLYFLSPGDVPRGVVLLGDAIHCFPPDTGQGVNSALEDVCVLYEALSQSDNDISRALPLYESWRFPDVKALVRIAQIAYPWQYNQAPLRKRLWSVNAILRVLLSKLLPQIFSPPAIFMISNHQLSYRDILSKADSTTRIIYIILGLALVLGLLGFGLPF